MRHNVYTLGAVREWLPQISLKHFISKIYFLAVSLTLNTKALIAAKRVLCEATVCVSQHNLPQVLHPNGFLDFNGLHYSFPFSVKLFL
jgi:hypothetical protein